MVGEHNGNDVFIFNKAYLVFRESIAVSRMSWGGIFENHLLFWIGFLHHGIAIDDALCLMHLWADWRSCMIKAAGSWILIWRRSSRWRFNDSIAMGRKWEGFEAYCWIVKLSQEEREGIMKPTWLTAAAWITTQENPYRFWKQLHVNAKVSVGHINPNLLIRHLWTE